MNSLVKLLLIVFCTCNTIYGQNKCKPTLYPGQVVLNSIRGTGVDGTQIVVDGSLGPQTSSGGNYRIRLDKCPGSIVRLQIIKKNYAIVNHVEMSGHVIKSNFSKDDLQFLTVICLEKDLETYRLKYYNDIADLNFFQELNRLNKQIDVTSKKLIQSEIKNEKLSAELNYLKSKYEELNKNFSAQQQQRNNLAKIFSTISIESIDSIYQKAFAFYKVGNLEKAQEVLSAKSIEKDSLLYENYKQISEQVESVKAKAKNIWMNKALLKASIFDSQFDYRNAYIWYKKAAYIDTAYFFTSFQFAEFLKNDNQLNESEKWFEISLRNAKNKIDSSIIYNGMGEIYSKSQRLKLSLKAFEKAILLYNSQNEESMQKYAPFRAALNNNISTTYLLQGLTNKAQPFLLNSLNEYSQLAKKDAHNFLPVLSIILNNYGLLFLKKNNMILAEKYLIDCIEIRKKLIEINKKAYEPAFANALCNLATLYNDNREYIKAEALFREAFEISTNLMSDNYERYINLHIMILSNMGSMYREKKQFEKAELYYQKSLEVYNASKQKDEKNFNLFIANYYLSMANICLEKKNFTKSESYFKKSLELKKKNNGDNLEYKEILINTLNGLGILYKDTDQFQLSEDTFKEALFFLSKSSESVDQTLSLLILKNLGNLYSKTNEKDKEEKVYKEIIIRADSLVLLSPNKYENLLMETLNNLGVFYEKKDNSKEANLCFARAIKIYESSDSKGLLSLAFVSICRNISSFNRENPNTSAYFLLEAEKIILSSEYNSKEDSIHLAYIYGDLGALYSFSNKNTESRNYYENSMRIFEKLIVKNDTTYNLILSSQLNNVAILFFREGSNMDTVKTLLERAFALRMNLYTKFGDLYATDVAEVENSLGVYYSHVNQFLKAENFYKKSINIYEFYFKKNNNNYRLPLIRSLNNLTNLYKKYNKRSAAEDTHRRVIEIDF